MKDSKSILQQIKKAVHTVDPGAELILFGSRARGDYHEESDWDVLVLTPKAVDLPLKRMISDALFYVQLNSGECISSLVLNKNDWNNKFKNYPLHLEIEADGLVL